MKYLIFIALSWACLSWGDINPLLEMENMEVEPSAKQVQEWIDDGAKINEQNNDSLTPLIIAAKKKWHRTVKKLLDNKAHVNDADKDGNTALIHTAYNNDLITAQVILEHQALAHQGDHTLTERIVESMTKRFESDYVKIDTYNKEHKTAFIVAVQEGFLEYAKLLRSYKANIDAQDANKQTSVFYAVTNKNLPMLQYLIREKANLKIQDKNKNLAIQIAIHLKLYSFVEALAHGGSPLNDSSEEHPSPVHMAVMELDARMIQILRRVGANMDNTNTGEQYRISPLALLFVLPDVSEDKMLEIAQIFIEEKANLNTIAHSPIEKNTFLHITVNKEYEKLVDLLLNAKARFDILNAEGLSSFLSAIRKGNVNIVQSFLKTRANPNQKPSNNFHFYPLHLAVYLGWVEIVDILLEADASVKIRDENGNTALNRVVDIPFLSHKKTEAVIVQIIQKLLDAKADINTQDNDGLTLAMKAVRQNNFLALQTLADNNADLTLTDNLGRDVFDHLSKLKEMRSDLDTSKVEKILSDYKNSSDPSNCERSLTGPA